MDDSEIQQTLQKKKGPIYANILNALRKQALDEEHFTNPNRPLAPLQPGLFPPVKATNNDKEIGASNTKPKPLSSCSIPGITEQTLKESEKRLKAIQDHMLLHRQEERDLKRTEADLLRQQKQMEQRIEQYKKDISKRKEEELKIFQEREASYSNDYYADLHSRGQMTKDRIQSQHDSTQKWNEDSRRQTRKVNELDVRCKNIKELIESANNAIKKMSSEYEAKMREKEDEKRKLEQEMASLTIKLNMESQKKRQHAAEHQRNQSLYSAKETVAENNREVKVQQRRISQYRTGAHHEQNLVKLDQQLTQKQDTMRAKQAQNGRNLAEIHVQAKQKSELQHFADQEADFVHVDILREKLKRNLDAASAKRQERINEYQKQLKEKNDKRYQAWAQRAINMENEAEKQEGMKRVNKLTKSVAHRAETERSLYTTAKHAETQQKKEVMKLEKLESDLTTLMLQNTRKLKEVAVEGLKAENELSLKIQQQKADLSKITNTKEENMRSLTEQRMIGRQEKLELEKEKREYLRKLKITERTTDLADDSAFDT